MFLGFSVKHSNCHLEKIITLNNINLIAIKILFILFCADVANSEQNLSHCPLLGMLTD